ncbi:MAG TPA: NAD(P)H-binding protein, partial [Acidimicrobiales bacterium]
MKVFVAGATGAIGRFAVPALRGAGHDVTAVARSDAKAQELREQGATAVTASIFDREALVPLVAGHDAVVQIATHIPPTRQAGRASAWAENDRIRRQASAALAGAAADAGVGRYVQESITFTYPDRGDAWIDEDVPVDPPEALSSVLDAEAAARRFTGAGGTGVVLRFGALYGPGSEQTAMIARLARRHVGMVMGRAGGYVSVLHLADAGTAVVAALGVPAGTYNAVDEEPVTKGEMARIVGEAVGARPWVHLPGRLTPLVARGGPGALARSQRVSGAKLRDAAGWRPRYRSLRVAWLEETGWLDGTGWGVGPAAPDG